MKLFDNRVQETKYKVLREVAVQAWEGHEIFAELNAHRGKCHSKGSASPDLLYI